MASPSSIAGLTSPQEAVAAAASAEHQNLPRLLICVPSLPPEALQTFLEDLATVFRREEVLIASPDLEEPGSASPLALTVLDAARVRSDWVLTASDFLAANDLAQKHDAAQILLLGSDVCSLPPAAIRHMADRVGTGTDLAMPAYSLGQHDGLVASALLYPLTRALFATNVRFPLPLDVGMSRRMSDRIAIAARRHTGSQPDALLWPVTEAATAGFTVHQIDAQAATPSTPPSSDFSTLFTTVTGSLFSDIEVKAPFWQRARSLAATQLEPIANRVSEDSNRDDIAEELPGMVHAFRLAYTNLQEIWSLALPPQSLLALKKLSMTEPGAFAVTPSLWARIVYDFALAYHLRTLNRGHLMGAFTPLYLAWVASTLRVAVDDTTAAAHREETASAFEREKPYLVARWRWPDRFNP